MLEISAFNRLLNDQKYWLLDGAIGTELERRGYQTSLPFWTAPAVREVPELLRDIYRQYLQAGCQILTANTFRISAYLFDKYNRNKEFLPLLVETCQIARELIPSESFVLLGGSQTTLEDCYRPDLVPDEHILKTYHRKQLLAFKECDVDFVLAETINSIREAQVILELAEGMGIPLVLSLITNGMGELLSGESLLDFLEVEAKYTPSVLSLNCRPVSDLLHDAKLLADNYSGPKGIYANAPGIPHSKFGWESSVDACERMTYFTEEVMAMGFKMIGGCCGTSPEMLMAMAREISYT